MSQIEKLERKNTEHFILLCKIKHKSNHSKYTMKKKKYNTKLETVTNEPTRKAVFSRIQKNKVDSRKKSHVRRKGKDQIQQ